MIQLLDYSSHGALNKKQILPIQQKTRSLLLKVYFVSVASAAAFDYDRLNCIHLSIYTFYESFFTNFFRIKILIKDQEQHLERWKRFLSSFTSKPLWLSSCFSSLVGFSKQLDDEYLIEISLHLRHLPQLSIFIEDRLSFAASVGFAAKVRSAFFNF